MKTTLNQIRKHSPCGEGWTKLLKHLGKTQADDEPLSIATIVTSNGLENALWCLKAVEDHDKEIRLFAVWCARQVQHLMTDKRSLYALDVAEQYARGEATNVELRAARAAALAKAGARAGDAARAAQAAGDAARAAAWAAGDAAWEAARAAAWAAGDAGDAARDAVVAAQEQELLRLCAE
jgi:hypothetical protein